MIEPLQEAFMQRALAEIALIGLASGALGCWVVLYEFSYAAESLAHSIFSHACFPPLCDFLPPLPTYCFSLPGPGPNQPRP